MVAGIVIMALLFCAFIVGPSRGYHVTEAGMGALGMLMVMWIGISLAMLYVVQRIE